MNDDLFNTFKYDDDDDPFHDDLGLGDGNDDFSFDEDQDDLGDIGAGLDSFDDDDLTSFDDDPGGKRGPNTAFIILAILMFLTFLGGIGLILFLATREPGLTDFDVESTQIAIENAGTIAAATETAIVRNTSVVETEIAMVEANTLTAEAQATSAALTEAANAQLTADAQTAAALTEVALNFTPTPIGGINAGFDLPGTQTAVVLNLTATAAQMTADAGNLPSPTPIAPQETQDLGVQPTIPLDEVAATATAIAQALRGDGTSPTLAVSAPTVSGGAGSGDGEAQPQDENLPQTGLLDDLASDQGLLMVVIAAIGLLAVIAVSRTVRAANSRYL